MAERFVFRQVDYRDIPTFLADREVRSKNHPDRQICHQTSYQNLVERRGTNEFELPYGGVVNDYVAFYFSPLTSFTFAIHRGKVQVIPPNNGEQTISRLEDRAFLVARVVDLYEENLQCCFSNYALNSTVPMPVIINDLNMLESHIRWNLFDEIPQVAHIPEVGYNGVCKYFNSRAIPEHHQLRTPIRMAEFLVRTAVPMNIFTCIIAPNEQKRALIQSQVHDAGYQLQVFAKPGCFIS